MAVLVVAMAVVVVVVIVVVIAVALIVAAAVCCCWWAVLLLQVEDVNSIRMLGQRLLSRAGAQCSTAADGVLAVAAVHSSVGRNLPFHVVLMDFHMPNMDGLQAMQ